MDDVDLWVGILDASRDGDVKRVRELLDRGANVNSQDILAGYTPVHFAIEGRNAALLRLLIDRGADIEHDRNTVYQTPLGTAVLSGQTELVRILLAVGAGRQRETVSGQSIACGRGIAGRALGHRGFAPEPQTDEPINGDEQKDERERRIRSVAGGWRHDRRLVILVVRQLESQMELPNHAAFNSNA